ncbi:MAG: extracellular solute-binding protein, partial [Halanaerobiales bacterium]|nr:extracellular solute-binding protein [Halanaerobiales bacterium]
MKIKSLTLILIFALVFSLTFAVSAQEKTLRVSWWGSQTRHDQTLKIIEMFEEEYPNINIEPEYTGWSGYWDKLFAQAAGDNLPDVLQHVRKYFGTWVEEDRLLDLEPYVKDGILSTKNIPDSVMDLGRYKGKLVGMPLGVNAITTIYNPDLLEKAGLDRTINPDWTWQDIMEMSKQIHDELKIWSTIGLLKDDLGHFQIWLRQNGASLYNDAGTGLGYQDDQLFAEFFAMEKELLDYGAVAPLGLRRELVHTVEEDPITDGTAAMTTQRWSNQFVAITAAAGDFGDKFKMTTVPSKKGGEKGLFVKASQHFAVSKNTEY